MNSSIILCPCGAWHPCEIRVTERYSHRFTCGLYVILDRGEAQYEYEGRPVEVIDLASGTNHLFVRLAQ